MPSRFEVVSIAPDVNSPIHGVDNRFALAHLFSEWP